MIVEGLILALSLSSITLASELAHGNNLLANELFRKIDTKDKNVVFSPLSVHILLSLAYEGASGTLEQTLREALHVGSKAEIGEEYRKLLPVFGEEANVTARIANKIYVPRGTDIKENFLNSVLNNFNSEIGKVNFADSAKTAGEINDWVKEKTNGKIDKIIEESDLDALTKIILLNAIYFKGIWDGNVAFSMSGTSTLQFHVSSKEAIFCPFMTNHGVYSWSASKRLDAHLLKLPYVDNRYSLIIMLPNKVNGIDEIEEKLVGVSLSSYLNEFEEKPLLIAIPKFKIEYQTDLIEPLKQIGFEDIFSKNANFSEIAVGNERLIISKVMQKAAIEVNEEGTEAAASTGERICVKCESEALRKNLDWRCQGHGVAGRVTRWSAFSAPHCHGKWLRAQPEPSKECPAKNCPSNSTFIFV